MESGGFCKKHSKDLIEMGKAHEMSVVYENLVNGMIPRLERLLKDIGIYEYENRLRKIIHKITGSDSKQEVMIRLRHTEMCPICKSVSDSEDKWTQELIMYLKDKKLKEFFIISNGLCLNHFRQALKSASPETAELLIRKQTDVLRKLKYDLEEYMRTRDYRYAHEPKGEEQKGWIKAISFFAGKEL